MDEDDGAVQDVQFADLANHHSVLHTDVPPSRFFLTINSARLSRDGTKRINPANVLSQAVQDSDQEAFVHILDLMRVLPDPLEPEPYLLTTIIDVDSPEILDEFIRRTGAGIVVDPKAISRETEGAARHEFSVYLGLNVHGKKRKDLAVQLNRDHTIHSNNERVLPLLWQAACYGSRKIMKYLCLDSPLTAFKYYAMSGSGEEAKNLRLLKDLDSYVKSYLGAQANPFNETAMTAVMFASKKDVALSSAKELLSLHPAQAQTFLHARYGSGGLV